MSIFTELKSVVEFLSFQLENTALSARQVNPQVEAKIAELLLSSPDKPRPCPLLEVFRNRASDNTELMKIVARLIGDLNIVFSQNAIEPDQGSLLAVLQSSLGISLRGMVLRCATLQVVWKAMGPKRVDRLDRFIQKLVAGYQELFFHRVLGQYPSFQISISMHRFSSASQP